MGLHFTYFDKLDMQGFNLVPSKMASWPLRFWIVFIVLCFVPLTVIGFLLYFYIKAEILLYYGLATLLIILAYAVPALILCKTHEVHVHHYNFASAFVVLIGYQSLILAPFSGIFNGMFVEGVATYAYDPVFKKRKPAVENNSI